MIEINQMNGKIFPCNGQAKRGSSIGNISIVCRHCAAFFWYCPTVLVDNDPLTRVVAGKQLGPSGVVRSELAGVQHQRQKASRILLLVLST